MTFESFIFNVKMSINHYENFPVASLLMPTHLRPAVRCLYHFARSADDLADEGSASAEERIQALEAYESELQRIKMGLEPHSPLFQALAPHIEQHQIPLGLFYDLLSAFKQDTQVSGYAHFDDLLDYCRRSANPVGRMMLALFKAETPENLECSDHICTALQLINFWQDIYIDWGKSRIYIPKEDLQTFMLPLDNIPKALTEPTWPALMQFQIERARSMMLSGAPLACRLGGRVGWELRLVVQGGLRILEKLEASQGDVLHQRPKLFAWDAPLLLWRAMWMKA